tara:strand:- start:268 stop:600 length:333 start_codon:yes stop_codon:yes gene_type:complete
MEIATNKEKRRIRVTLPNAEIIFIQLENVKVRDGHEGEGLTSCDLMIDGEKSASWEVMDMGGGTIFHGVGENKYVKGELGEGRHSLDISLNGNIYNSDFLEQVIEEILDC